ncbi:MAG: polysaccharide biosynthesis tyrosine autokinase [Propionibacteriaceae bacterium]|nr:polysaccharide biosynthesis tyrosine autokinase [Propionibacteriaceae bacterium]
MDVRALLAVLRKYWMSLLGATVLGAILAATYVAVTPPTYTAESQVFLGVQGGQTTSDLVQGSSYATTVARNFALVATTPKVLDGAIKDLNLDTTPQSLATHITTSIPTNTSIINIDVIDGSAQQAADIAQSVAKNLQSAVAELSTVATSAQTTVTATIITPAIVPTSPTSPKLALTLALGLVLGLAIGVGQAVLRKTLDVSIRTEDDIAEATTHSVLARIPFSTSIAKDSLVIVNDPQSPLAEEYRRLRTNLSFMDLDSNRTPIYVVTSSLASEGKSVTAINLAFSFAEDDIRVLLIDADLRRPMVASYLNMESAAGLTTVLLGKARLADVVQHLGSDKVDILPIGAIPPNPVELIASTSMSRMLATAAQEYDVIVIDSAPLVPVVDTTLLSTLTTGTLVVVGSGKVKVQQLQEAIESLSRAKANILGVVLNMVKSQDGSGYGGNYYYYRPKDPKTSNVTLESDEPNPPDEDDSKAEKKKTVRTPPRPSAIPLELWLSEHQNALATPTTPLRGGPMPPPSPAAARTR